MRKTKIPYSDSLSHHDRREFLRRGGILAAGLATMPADMLFTGPNTRTTTIKEVRIDNGVVIETEDGTLGKFAGSPAQDLNVLNNHLRAIRKLLIGKDPLDRALNGELLWEAIYPDRAKAYAEGRDPLTDEVIANTPRKERHAPTGRVFMAFSTVDNALWDLRGNLLGKPLYHFMGDARRNQVPVYWRPGEASNGLDDACIRAREAYDRGYIYQKWYWTKSAKDGREGLKENIELVRRLREELPEAHLMFDNHSIRYFADVDYSVELCNAVAKYHPFWIEEPLCPEHLDGYARIKGETGVPIAGGEHWYTHWQAKAFLDRECVDFLQSDPVWCGGISEWLKICELAQQYPGVKVVPHITKPWKLAPHCVASQPADLCPILEYNAEGGESTLGKSMNRSPEGIMAMTLPEGPGIS